MTVVWEFGFLDDVCVVNVVGIVVVVVVIGDGFAVVSFVVVVGGFVVVNFVVVEVVGLVTGGVGEPPLKKDTNISEESSITLQNSNLLMFMNCLCKSCQ